MAVERAAALDTEVSMVGRRPGEASVRRMLHKSMAWYVDYFARQVGAFASAEVGALGLLESRVRAMEVSLGATAALSEAVQPGDRGQLLAATPVPTTDLSWWSPVILDCLAGTTGRVLHAECGTGGLLAALVRAGIDAYGVDPAAVADLGAAVEPTDPITAADSVREQAAALDVWSDDTLVHLGAVGDGGLAGLVLTGCVDRLAAPQLRRLASLAHSKLAPGGHLVLVSTTPEAWDATVSAPVADLVGSRPLHPGTWRYLLRVSDFEVIAVYAGPSSFAITALRR